MKPASILDIKADFRYRGTLNKGGYTAYNPLTGQFGRGFRNSTGFDLVVGSAGDPLALLHRPAARSTAMQASLDSPRTTRRTSRCSARHAM